ncbi:MAG: reverse transcriptase domain-containing protein, partial [Bacteroidota bacterium]
KLPVKWIFKKKKNPLGKFEKVRCRIVALGNLQHTEEGETYSPTLGYDSVRLLLATAASLDLDVQTGDVSSAFYEEIQTVHSIPLAGIGNRDGVLWKMKKYIYGLATALAQ